MKKFILIVVLFYVNINHSFSQAPDTIISKFFNDYKSNSIDYSLNNLFKTNTWILTRSKDDVDNIKVQLKSIVEIIGNYYGYEYITQKSIGQSFKLYSYLVKYDRQPLRFTFVFYKANDTWRVFNFQFDQDLTDELIESAKAFRLRENIDY